MYRTVYLFSTRARPFENFDLFCFSWPCASPSTPSSRRGRVGQKTRHIISRLDIPSASRRASNEVDKLIRFSPNAFQKQLKEEDKRLIISTFLFSSPRRCFSLIHDASACGRFADRPQIFSLLRCNKGRNRLASSGCAFMSYETLSILFSSPLRSLNDADTLLLV